MFEVDVLKDPLFCDEFSHVVNRRYLAPLTFRGILTSIQLLLLMFLSTSRNVTLIILLLDKISVFIQVFEVDVFEHPRFCDEFSHVLNRRFLASVSFRGILTSIQLLLLMFLLTSTNVTLIILLLDNISVFIQVFEVDVFEHPRFCDEFSHVLNRRFLASVSFRGILTSIQLLLLMFLLTSTNVTLIILLLDNISVCYSSV